MPADRFAFAFYVGHLLSFWAIALSNILLGLAILAAISGRFGRFADSGAPRLPASARPTARLASAYLLLLLASIAASQDPRVSFQSASELFDFGGLALALLLLRGEARVRWLVDLLILVGAVVAASGLAQLLFGFGTIEHRIRGPFSHYMTFAGTLLMIDLLIVARLIARRSRAGSGPTAWLDRPWVAWICLALVSVALIASLTRSAWIALVAGLALVVGRVRPRLLLAAPPLFAALLVVAPVPVVSRILSISDLSDLSNYDRVCMVDAGLKMVAERPLLGLGPDLVKRVYPLYRHPTAPRLLVPHLHNTYLQLAAERGIAELSVFVALLAGAFVAAWRGFARAAAGADVALGVVGGLTAFAVAGLFEHNWGDTEVQRVALFLIALPVALTATAEPATGEPGKSAA